MDKDTYQTSIHNLNMTSVIKNSANDFDHHNKLTVADNNRLIEDDHKEISKLEQAAATIEANIGACSISYSKINTKEGILLPIGISSDPIMKMLKLATMGTQPIISDELKIGDLWWSAIDSYNITAFDQTNGIWPLEHPLPLPDWSSETRETLKFDNVWQYEEMNALIEAKLHRMLEVTHYNTVNNFLDFYKAFKKTRRSDLKSFFQFYDIPINRRHHMCVSLAMEIIIRILEIFPDLAKYLYIVSCEEAVVQPQYYIDTCEQIGINAANSNVEKEHSLVAMKLSIAGRQGYMVLDPGYHVARAVTVMKDQCYPHTGWFTQSDEKHCKREYCYNYNIRNTNYIEWCEKETRGDKQEFKVNLVYVERPYRTAIDVTVRRNLVYDFRSLLARDAKGRVFAGLYFPLILSKNGEQPQFTLFYEGQNNQNVKAKLLFNVFKNSSKIPDHVTTHIEQLAPQLNIDKIELLDIFKSIAEVVTDQDFIKQVLSINDDINEMSADN
ncbi:uncharacterized protein LOC129606706 [Condylostylus longicornis]|uniref:uncharacterized protein LOC129606706 n=1 Tax=Condylostylus longicornis TaxID=2530218 RepID=UPI00244DCE42|nr:uncharacterized protein LOC129606706 [Condylostylus longicornis]XP_055373161.1 uncharacterized protein LOC129606706 [Condylostylus longicornis]XP_055373162.1 uncharacterized protein LOC129606706 [Condylostylus longicornis]XP_055373163.1 uncharacterized protein LOC129606706 [Condylostylus longicornis]XP_055373165.1 uncharacterized protein LOC129606706 [Condylostylus longicornis]